MQKPEATKTKIQEKVWLVNGAIAFASLKMLPPWEYPLSQETNAVV